jgi:hypothetical protein
MKTTLSLIASLGIMVAGISGTVKADHYHRVVENRVVNYIDSCNNLITVSEPVVRYYRHSDHIRYDFYGRPYSPYIYYPYVESWRYSDSKPRGLFGNRYYRRWGHY